MEMSFGKYKDKAVAWVLLEHPEYFAWMRKKEMTGFSEYQFQIKLIEKFDLIPFAFEKCRGTCKGSNQVSRISTYNGIYNGDYWFCDDCDPYSHGAIGGKLNTISRFNEAFRFENPVTIINAMARAKGLAKKKTKKALKEFFCY